MQFNASYICNAILKKANKMKTIKHTYQSNAFGQRPNLFDGMYWAVRKGLKKTMQFFSLIKREPETKKCFGFFIAIKMELRKQN